MDSSTIFTLQRNFIHMHFPLAVLLFVFACKNPNQKQAQQKVDQDSVYKVTNTRIKGVKVIHVFVALCDNKYQGIVPVPTKIGNGQDPDNNLYWGCSFGIREFFKKSKDWQLINKTKDPNGKILEACIFKHNVSNTFLIAEAYDGKEIKQCTVDFLKACAGQTAQTLYLNKINKAFPELHAAGAADLLCYIGHDGLMDFQLTEKFEAQDTLKREAIMLACISKKYFAPHLQQTKAQPLVWSTGLMSPEAYTLHAAIDKWIAKEPATSIRQAAASAYHQYQKCGTKAALNLLVSGY
jgi:hypothetical protein